MLDRVTDDPAELGLGVDFHTKDLLSGQPSALTLRLADR
jgi:hypothetical protein